MKTGTVLGIGCAILVVIGIVCAGLLGAGAWFGLNVLKELNGNAESFLSKVAAADYQGAYSSTASSWQQRETAEQFAASMKKSGLGEYSSATWTNWNVVNTTATLDGMMTLKSGGSAPVTVTMINEGGTWKVSNATTTASAPAKDKEKEELPMAPRTAK